MLLASDEGIVVESARGAEPSFATSVPGDVKGKMRLCTSSKVLSAALKAAGATSRVEFLGELDPLRITAPGGLFSAVVAPCREGA